MLATQQLHTPANELRGLTVRPLQTEDDWTQAFEHQIGMCVAASYLVPVGIYDAQMEMIEDHELAQIVEERRSDKAQAITVSLDDL